MPKLRRSSSATSATASFLVALVALAAVTSCKSSAEEEQKRHARLPAEVQRYAARYPGFSAVLKAELARAEEAFAHAKEQAKGEQRVERMKNANNIVFARIGEIERYERATRKLKRLLRSSEIRRQPRRDVDHLLREADRALDRAHAMVMRPVRRPSELTAALANAGDRLRSATRPLQRIQDRVDRQKRDQRKAERAARKAQKKAKQQQKK